MEFFTALLTLTAMEIILGIDNIVFIAILVGRMPHERQARTRSLGIGLALIIRIALLFSITWIMSLKEPWFSLIGHTFSGRDIILLLGGLFLIFKSTLEIHHKVEGGDDVSDDIAKTTGQHKFILFQILLLDIVFSLDSVITAVGMAQDLTVMILAMVISMIVMLVSAKGITQFVDKHPTIKILALSFLLLIGVMLVVEGMGGHIAKGYIYFAMFFSLLVEFLNMRYRIKKRI